MNKLNISLILLVFIAVTGCAVTATPEPTGGSRADGTIELSYEYGSFEQVTIDEDAAQVKAAERCKAWGYEGAEAFGGVRRQCQQSGPYGCTRFYATITYQCI